MSSLISAVSWVARGMSAQNPTKYTVDAAEMERVQALAHVRLQDARMELELAQIVEAEELEEREGRAAEDGDEDWSDEAEEAVDEDEEMDLEGDATAAAAAMAKTIKLPVGPDDLSAYNLDDYDEEEGRGAAMGAFSNVKGLSYYGDNSKDPYISLDTKQEDEELEREELEILPTDNLLVVAKTEDDVSQLEIYVYDESEENLYVHHDLLLPAMPLCLEWLDFCPGRSDAEDGKRGNYVAVGTLDPEIEIWSLDVVDGLYPDAILGPPANNGEEPTPVSSIKDSTPVDGEVTKKKKKKKPKKPKVVINAEYHVDSILSLSWNRSHRNLLASSSADKTIKLWDLSLPTSSPAIRSFDTLHADKIQSVQWNPKEPTVLLSGSWDGTVRVFDSRAPDGGVGTKVASDVECLKWDPWEPAGFLVSMENGLVQSYDSRMLSSAKVSEPSKALWTLSAHDASVSSLDINTKIKGCIVTGGTDNLVKIWNIEEQDGGKRHISLVASRDLGVGKVFSASFCPDDATTLAVAGSKASLQIWDTISNAGVRQVFGDRLRAFGKDVDAERRPGDGVVRLLDDDEGDSAAED